MLLSCIHANHDLIHSQPKSLIQSVFSLCILNQDSSPTSTQWKCSLFLHPLTWVLFFQIWWSISDLIPQELQSPVTRWSLALFRKPSSLHLLINMTMLSLKNHWKILTSETSKFCSSQGSFLLSVSLLLSYSASGGFTWFTYFKST